MVGGTTRVALMHEGGRTPAHTLTCQCNGPLCLQAGWQNRIEKWNRPCLRLDDNPKLSLKRLDLMDCCRVILALGNFITFASAGNGVEGAGSLVSCLSWKQLRHCSCRQGHPPSTHIHNCRPTWPDKMTAAPVDIG